jgi:hypothetical protein
MKKAKIESWIIKSSNNNKKNNDGTVIFIQRIIIHHNRSITCMFMEKIRFAPVLRCKIEDKFIYYNFSRRSRKVLRLQSSNGRWFESAYVLPKVKVTYLARIAQW